MITTSMMAATAFNDAELVADTLAGDCEAFGQIVGRYQSLICSLAYSATGSLGQSEDLARETFIIAWKASLVSFALAHESALGAVAYAAHFNDADARAFARDTRFFRGAHVVMRNLFWINLAWIIPLIFWWRVERPRNAASKQ